MHDMINMKLSTIEEEIDEMKRSSGYNAMHSEISEEITFSKLTYM